MQRADKASFELYIRYCINDCCVNRRGERECVCVSMKEKEECVCGPRRKSEQEASDDMDDAERNKKGMKNRKTEKKMILKYCSIQ